jgi:V8-like Glu-specific endopeptidase
MTICLPSTQSLFINIKFNDTCLSTATAFVVKSRCNQNFLITNRHNVTGRHQETDKCLNTNAGVPNQLGIFYHKKSTSSEWVEHTIDLKDENDEPVWFEHPELRSKADFVAIKLSPADDINIHSYDLYKNDKIAIKPTDIISVVGFPFGLKVDGFPIWATGFMASEPEINYDSLPIFLIDCRTRKGQSGSPAIAHRNGFYLPNDGSPPMYSPNCGSISDLLGIYSV